MIARATDLEVDSMPKINELAVIEYINQGLDNAAIAKLLDTDEAKIAEKRTEYLARGLVRGKTANPNSRISADVRRMRREEISRYLRDGHTHSEAAAKFGVSTGMVAQAAREFGGRVAKESTSQADLFKIAGMFILGMKDSEIADAVGLSRERVGTMRESATEAGLFAACEKLAVAARMY